MAKVTLRQYGERQFGGAAGAYGNTTTLRFQLVTIANGSAQNADVPTRSLLAMSSTWARSRKASVWMTPRSW